MGWRVRGQTHPQYVYEGADVPANQLMGVAVEQLGVCRGSTRQWQGAVARYRGSDQCSHHARKHPRFTTSGLCRHGTNAHGTNPVVTPTRILGFHSVNHTHSQLIHPRPGFISPESPTDSTTPFEFTSSLSLLSSSASSKVRGLRVTTCTWSAAACGAAQTEPAAS